MLLIRMFVAVFIVISAVIAIVYNELGLAFIAQMMGVSWGALAGAFLAPYLYSLYWKRTTKASCYACFVFGVVISIAALIISLNAGNLPEAFKESFINIRWQLDNDNRICNSSDSFVVHKETG